jgi:DNA polymerase III alpha subunit
MAFVRIEDRYGEIEAILFPGSYQQTVGIWERDKVVLIRGKVNAKDKDGNASTEPKIMVDDAREITSAQASAYEPTGKKQRTPKVSTKKKAMQKNEDAEPVNPRLYIRLLSSEDQDVLVTLKQTLDSFQGSTDVVLVLGEAANKQVVKLPTGVDRDSEAIERLRELVGVDNVKVQ